MIMAQETGNVDYESMVDKYMNEWEGCNLREFCFSEKVNIYRMLKTMKRMGVKKEPVPYGLKPLEFSESADMCEGDDGKACFDDGCVSVRSIEIRLMATYTSSCRRISVNFVCFIIITVVSS